MYEPKTAEEYLHLIDEAVAEVEEVIVCAQDEDDVDTEFTRAMPYYQQILAGLKTLREEVAAGTHAYGDGKDLPFMEVVRLARGRIPFTALLNAINVTHKRSL